MERNSKILREYAKIELIKKEKNKLIAIEERLKNSYRSGKITKKEFEEKYSLGVGGKSFGALYLHHNSSIGLCFKNIESYKRKRKVLNVFSLCLLIALSITLFFLSFDNDITGRVVEGEVDNLDSTGLQENLDPGLEEEPIIENPQEEVLEEVVVESNEENSQELPLEEAPTIEETPLQEIDGGNNETGEILDIELTNESELSSQANDSLVNESEEDTQPEANLVLIGDLGNETATLNISEVSLVNESILNETLVVENLTIGDANITTMQYGAVLGQPVRWKKIVELDEAGSVVVSIPEIAENVNVTKVEYEDAESSLDEETTGALNDETLEEPAGDLITSQESSSQETISPADFTITGNVVSGVTLAEESKIVYWIKEFFKRLSSGFTGRVIDGEMVQEAVEEEITHIELAINDNATTYLVEYETPAPYAIETDLGRGKRVEIIGVEGLHYENVLAFTELSENFNLKSKEKLKIYWKENNSYIYPTLVEDIDLNGVYDYVEWVAPHLSNQTFEIILITKAERLDENKTFVEDIYDYVKNLDGNWTTLNDSQYVRVTFEIPLDSTRDITLYARSNLSNSSVHVYEFNSTNKVADFGEISEEKYYKIYLTNITNTSDVFDLKILGEIEFDLIIDPQISPNLEAGLVALYHFDNDSRFGENDTHVYDYSGNGNNGTVGNGTVMNTSGNIAGSVTFDGVDDYISIKDGWTQFDNNFTISLWTKTYYGSQNQIIFTTTAGGGGVRVHYYYNWASGRLTYSDDTCNTLQALTPTNDVWSSQIITREDTGLVKIYIDGVLAANSTSCMVGSYNLTSGTDDYLSIGKSAVTAGSTFNGSIDEVAIYNRSLNASEVLRLYQIGVPTNVTNVWSCNSPQNWANSSCWSLGRVPAGYDDVIFNGTGLGNVNVTNNTMPQYLNSFTIAPSYNGTINFFPLFSVGNWTGRNDGTQMWNVTGDINISGGTVKVWGDYRLNDTYPGVFGNITREGHGQIWKSLSGNITIGSGAVLDGVGLGFNGGFAVGVGGGPGQGYGATHGGQGSSSSRSRIYGNASAPTSLGSGAWLAAGHGGSAIKLESSNKINIFGSINMTGVNAGYTGSGGSIWLKGSTLNVSGLLNVGVDNPQSAGYIGGGGRMRLEYSNNMSVSGRLLLGGISADGGVSDPGTLTLTNNTWRGDWDLYSNIGLLGGDYGDGNTTNVIGNFNTNGYNITVYGDCFVNVSNPYMCYNRTTEGRGVWINASGNITVSSNSILDGIELGFPGYAGPGFSGSASIGSSHGGRGGGNSLPTYGNETEPMSLGSGGYTSFGAGSAIRLESSQNLIFNGQALMYSLLDGNPGSSGGSIMLKASSITGNGLLDSSGRDNNGWSAGGAGRIALIATDAINFTGSIINRGGYDSEATGGYLSGSGGTVYLYAGNYISLSGNISVIGANGTLGSGQRINLSSSVINLSGIYNASIYNLSDSSVSKGNISLSYTNCSTSYSSASFDPSVFVSSYPDCISPNMSFVSPTPLTESLISRNFIYANVSVSDDRGNVSTFVDFDNSLIGWWRMDDYNSTHVFDYTGRNNGTIYGNARVGSGKLGRGFSFDGVGDRIGFSSGTVWNMSVFTLSLWVNHNEETGSYDMAIGSAGPGSDKFYIDVRNNYVQFNILNNSEWVSALFFTSLNNEWHHISGVFDGTMVSLYIDGDLKKNVTFLGTYTPHQNAPNIGNYDGSGDATYSFNGSIDDVMIFNRSLSGAEVQGLYANTSSRYVGNNFTSLSDGTHTFKAYSQDSSGNINFTEERTVFIDATVPGLSFVSPSSENASKLNSNSVYVNTSSSDSLGNISTFIDFDNSLVGWWRMDDYNSTHVFDYTGRNNATIVGDSLVNDSGAIGKSFSFDGNQDFLRVDAADSLNFTTGFSASFWLKRPANYSAWSTVLGKESWDSGNGWFVFFETSNGAQLRYCRGGCGAYSLTTTVGADSWTHVVITNDNGSASMYVNGTLSTSGTIPISNWPNDFYIGARHTNGGGAGGADTFNGSLDDVMLFNRSLSGAEVVALYTNTSSRYVGSNFTNLSEGSHTFRAYSQDSSGNVNSTSIRSVSIDTILPTVEFVSPTPSNGELLPRTYSFLNVSSSDSVGNISTFVDFDNSLVGWWRMDDYNSTHVLDYTGRNDATFQNGASLENPGKFGKGFRLYGGTEYLQITNKINYENLSNLSVSYWYREDVSSSNNVEQRLVSMYIGSLSFMHSKQYSETFIFQVSNTSISPAADVTIGNDSNWHFIVGVYNGTHIQIYVDANNTDSTPPELTGRTRVSTSEIEIGWQESNRNGNGSIDDVMIFNKSLSLAEIQGLYANTSSKYFQKNYTLLSDGVHTFRAYSQDLHGNVNYTEARSFEVVSPGLNVWNCTVSSLWSNSSCWTGRRIPVAGDYIVFNGTGTGNVNVTNNTMPQDLANFTVASSYTGTMNFFPLFAVGNWTGRNDGTQMWNVTGDINISGGTVKVWGDYRLNDTYPGVFGNITNEGHGQIWKSLSGNITIGSGAVIDGFTLGFSPFTGPIAGQFWGCGGGHGGLGCSENVYGNASAPTSLGSGASYGGGSAIKLESVGFANVLGQINMSGFGVGPDGSAGGSIWIKSNNISLSGQLLAASGSGWGYSGGGRIRLEYGQNLNSSATISVSGSNNNGGDYTSRAAGTLTFTNNTWPGDWNLTGNIGLLGGNYGEGNVTNVRGSFNTNGYNLTVYGDCYFNRSNSITCYNQSIYGAGVWINTSGNITISSNSILYGHALGFNAGPGSSSSYASGHGGKGGGIPQSVETIYGSFTHPTTLGSGIYTGNYGGSAVKLESLEDISLGGRITVNADVGSSGGSILVIGRSVSGSGILSAIGGVGTNEAGGGGRIAIISNQLTNFSGIINVSGGLPGNPSVPRWGSGGTAYLISNETIYLSANLSTIGINGSSSGGQVNITAPSVFILSGNYNTSRINLSDNNFNGILSINYSNCSSDISGGTFDPENPDVPDCENPEIQILFPAQSTYYNNASGDITRINFTVYDENLQTCKYSLNNGTTNFTTSCYSNITGLSSNPGWNTWTVYANDTGDMRGYALENLSVVTFYKDLVLPVVSNLSGMPTNNSVGGALTTFNFTATDDLDSNLTCYPTYSGSVENGTNVVYLGNGSSTSVQRILNGGPHVMNITCYDEANNSHQNVGINYLVAVINVTSPTNNQIARIGNSNDFVVEEIEGEDFLNTASVFILNSSGTILNIINTTGDPEHSGSYNWSGLSPQYITARISVYNDSAGMTQNVSEDRNLILLRASGNTITPELNSSCSNETYVVNNSPIKISLISDLDTLLYLENVTLVSPNGQMFRLINETYSFDSTTYTYRYNYSFVVNQTGTYILLANMTDYENQSDSWNYTIYSSSSYNLYRINSSVATMTRIDQCLPRSRESGTDLTLRVVSEETFDMNITIADLLHNITLRLNQVNLTQNLTEAIGYTELTNETSAPSGMRKIALFELNTTINFSNYTLIYDYSPIAHTINNESTIKIYKCSNTSDCNLDELDITLDETNNRVIVDASDFSYFLVGENSSGASIVQTITLPSSGGGTRTVEKTVYRSLNIITPGKVTLGLKDKLIVPIILRNPEEIDLEDISLNAVSTTTDVSPVFEKEKLEKLSSKENETVLLFLESHSFPGEYEIHLNVTVGDPEFEEEAVLYVRLVDSLVREEIVERITAAQKLFLEDPRCLELNDLLEEAKRFSDEGRMDDALQVINNVISECRELIMGLESPSGAFYRTPVWAIPVMASLTVLVVILIILLILRKNRIYSKVRLGLIRGGGNLRESGNYKKSSLGRKTKFKFNRSPIKIKKSKNVSRNNWKNPFK